MADRQKARTEPVILARARQLRRPQTPAEGMLWARLRNRQLGGFKFRRQHPVGKAIVDFYCDACHLAIEIDGDSHAEQAAYDATRTHALEERGVRVIRFTNRDVMHNLDAVLETILEECRERGIPSP